MTRFRLTASTTAPAVSPALQSYTHTQTSRRRLLVSDVSALTTSAYAPDGTDHIAAGDAHHVQFVSGQLEAGISFASGQTIKYAVQCLEANTNNNLFVQLYAAVVDSTGGTVRRVLRSKVSDNLEINTSRQSRTLSTTQDGASYTTVAGDRLVVEFSVSGTPTSASQTQGHNATFFWGSNGAGGDLAENDTQTGTTLNGWIEFAPTVTFSGSDAYSTAVLADNPIAYYRLDDAGSTAADYVSGYDGSLSATGVTTGAAGAISGNAAMTFNGSTGQVTVAGFPAIAVPWSLECWVNVPASGTNPVLMQTPDTSVVDLTTAGVFEYWDGNGAVNVGDASARNICDGQWHHIAVTRTSTTLTLYLDGAQAATASVSPYNFTSGTAGLAAKSAGSNWLTGTLDEAAIYNTALSSTRVAAHYSAAGSATNLSIANAAHVETVGSLALTQVHSLTVAGANQAETAPQLSLAQVHQLTAANAAHTETAQSPTLTQVHQLSVGSASHAEAAGALTLAQVHQLAIQNAAQAEAANTVALGVDLVVASAAHAETASNLALTQAHSLAVDNAAQAEAVDSLILGQVHQLGVQGASEAQTAQALDLTQAHQLAVQDAAQAEAADNVGLGGASQLGIADAASAQTAEQVSLTQAHQLAVQGAAEAQAVDGLVLGQVHELVAQDALQAMASGSPTLIQDHQLAVQDAAHLEAADTVTLSLGALAQALQAVVQAVIDDQLAQAVLEQPDLTVAQVDTPSATVAALEAQELVQAIVDQPEAVAEITSQLIGAVIDEPQQIQAVVESTTIGVELEEAR